MISDQTQRLGAEGVPPLRALLENDATRPCLLAFARTLYQVLPCCCGVRVLLCELVASIAHSCRDAHVYLCDPCRLDDSDCFFRSFVAGAPQPPSLPICCFACATALMKVSPYVTGGERVVCRGCPGVCSLERCRGSPSGAVSSLFWCSSHPSMCC